MLDNFKLGKQFYSCQNQHETFHISNFVLFANGFRIFSFALLFCFNFASISEIHLEKPKTSAKFLLVFCFFCVKFFNFFALVFCVLR